MSSEQTRTEIITQQTPLWEEKCWGRVQHIFASSHAAVSILEVNAGWRCSIHLHEDRVNLFAVQSGLLVVEMFEPMNSMHLLKPGDRLEVPSWCDHRFRVLESGHVTEVYWPAFDGIVRLDDIVRRDVGRRDNLDILKEVLKVRGLL